MSSYSSYNSACQTDNAAFVCMYYINNKPNLSNSAPSKGRWTLLGGQQYVVFLVWPPYKSFGSRRLGTPAIRLTDWLKLSFSGIQAGRQPMPWVRGVAYLLVVGSRVVNEIRILWRGLQDALNQWMLFLVAHMSVYYSFFSYELLPQILYI